MILIPSAEIFVVENGEPTKKNITELLKDKKGYFVWFARSLHFSLFS